MLSFDKCVQEKLVLLCIFAVTPCVGVWIEIIPGSHFYILVNVTPCVGVWIEICKTMIWKNGGVSHSLRGSVD